MEGFALGLAERSISLDSSPSSARVARQFVHQALGDLGRLDLDADALLCVSELVANAVRYSPGPCEVVVSEVGGAVRLDVRDTSIDIPKLGTPPLLGSGRGMTIVIALAARWGVDVERTAGKSVWCQLEGS